MPGYNSIPLTVPPWLSVAGKELCRFFYVYQTMMIWLYFSWFYYQVCCVPNPGSSPSCHISRHGNPATVEGFGDLLDVEMGDDG